MLYITPCRAEEVNWLFGSIFLHLECWKVGQAWNQHETEGKLVFTRLCSVIIQNTEFLVTTTSSPTHCLSCFSGDTATCLYNSPHEDESLPRVLPGKLLTLDAQCRKDRGTSACFVSLLISSTKLFLIDWLVKQEWVFREPVPYLPQIIQYSAHNGLKIVLLLGYLLKIFKYGTKIKVKDIS
jgi:hypothetical protein